MVAPKDCWKELSENENSILLDVRTNPEIMYVGAPDLASIKRPVIRAEFMKHSDAGFVPNPEFFELAKSRIIEKFPDFKTSPPEKYSLFFICKAGPRGNNAAKTFYEHGYKNSYCIRGGFEGDLNGSKLRGKVSGWVYEGLPYVQS